MSEVQKSKLSGHLNVESTAQDCRSLSHRRMEGEENSEQRQHLKFKNRKPALITSEAWPQWAPLQSKSGSEEGLLSGEASWFIRTGLCTYLLAEAPLG